MPRLPQNFYWEKFKGANLGAQKILGAKEGAKLKNLMYLTKNSIRINPLKIGYLCFIFSIRIKNSQHH